MTLLLGDSLEQLRTLDANSVDAVVTDPPYGLSKEPDIAEVMQHWINGDKYEHGSKGFMGKSWDSFVPGPEYWREVYRVLKPGAHVAVFAGTRTWDLMSCALRFAGFQNRDTIASFGGPPGLAWTFGSGFPKSLNVYKAALKAGLCCECEVNKNNDFRSENMPDLQRKVGAENALPSDAKQDMRPDLLGDLDFEKGEGQGISPNTRASVNVPDVRQEFSPLEGLGEESKDDVLQSPVQRCGAWEGMGGARTQGSAGEDSKELREGGDAWPEKSGVEGRSDIQAQQGQLHRSEVCAVPGGVFADGSQGRLHNGTSLDSGSALGPDALANRSGAPQGPQYPQQSDTEPRTIPEQSSAQTCRGCGKAILSEGLGTALKPAWEVILIFRKPFDGPVYQNVLKWGTGAINVDASRIATDDTLKEQSNPNIRKGKYNAGYDGRDHANYIPSIQGRWPANVLLDEDAAEGLDAANLRELPARYFYCAKASKRERNAGLEGMPLRECAAKQNNSAGRMENGELTNKRPPEPKAQNHHPTVKPVRLMEYLVRMICPPGGVCLDPFMGSGTTGVACARLGVSGIGIEREAEYIEIAKRRIAHARERTTKEQP